MNDDIFSKELQDEFINNIRALKNNSGSDLNETTPEKQNKPAFLLQYGTAWERP